jgi:hypothetical protein
MRNEVKKNTILEAEVLVLLREVIYEVCRWDDLRWRDIHTMTHDVRFRHSSNIKDITSTVWEVTVLVLLMRGNYNVHQWDGLRWHDMYIPSFIKIGTGIQAILRFSLKNLRGCNVGITDGRNLWITPLRWAHVSWYTNQAVINIGSGIQEFSRTYFYFLIITIANTICIVVNIFFLFWGF